MILISCPYCGSGFIKKVADMGLKVKYKCPDCSRTFYIRVE